MKLTIELVPSTAWGKNVRSHVSADRWDRMRRACYVKAGHRCEICGGAGPGHPVECHEIWEYNDHVHTQTLTGLIALCPTCHKVKHAGLALHKGQYRLVIRQLCRVNGWTEIEANAYIDQAMDQWARRSLHKWTLDLSWLEGATK